MIELLRSLVDIVVTLGKYLYKFLIEDNELLKAIGHAITNTKEYIEWFFPAFIAVPLFALLVIAMYNRIRGRD